VSTPGKRKVLEIHPVSYTPFFSFRRGELCCERVALERIARRVGTPAYVYSSASVTDAYRRFDRAFSAVPHQICYAVKANSNLALLRQLARLGSAFDIVSGGELYRLRRIGVAGARIVFSGVGKTRDEIREALREKILLFNVESEAELELLAEEASRAGCAAPAGLRVNPDVQAGGHPHISTGHRRHKFGVDLGDARRLYLAYRSAKGGPKAVRWLGISAHIGSQILDAAPFARAATRIARLARELQAAGIPLRYLDLGGGFAVRYAGEQPPDLRRYAAAIVPHVRSLGCTLLLEPGRVLVGPAGVLLARVLYTKRNGGRTFVVVDAGMNDFQRPALYGAVHPVTTASSSKANTGQQRVDVVGPVCETGDSFLHDALLPPVEPGDLLVLWGAGAYGFVASSNYNSRQRPPEILVTGKSFRVVRRRETRAELVRGE
jgi:diaminopimelate decarboxylase